MTHSLIKEITDKTKSRELTIGVVGLGYVGLPLAIRFANENFNVIGFDIDQEKIDKLSSGQTYIKHITDQSIKEVCPSSFKPTSDYKYISKCDAVIICVPTPLDQYREPDLSYVTSTLSAIQDHLRKGQLISLESTTYPGTTEEIIRPVLESRGFTVGHDIFLVFSPEREDPGNEKFKTHNIPKICGGSTAQCLEVGLCIYSSVIEKMIPVSSTKTAEMTKLLENIHRAVNIGLINEMKILCDKMDINIHEVIDAAATKPFGFTPYRPGPGLGGHCIPVDPFYLTWKAREYGLHTRFIELSGEINHSMPDYVIAKTIEALNQREKSVKGSKILILGIAYKKNVDDMRESPSVMIMSKLAKLGAKLNYSDPHIAIFPKLRNYNFDMTSVNITADIIKGYDAIILATNHDDFDYELIRREAQLIVDTRGIYPYKADNVIQA